MHSLAIFDGGLSSSLRAHHFEPSIVTTTTPVFVSYKPNRKKKKKRSALYIEHRVDDKRQCPAKGIQKNKVNNGGNFVLHNFSKKRVD